MLNRKEQYIENEGIIKHVSMDDIVEIMNENKNYIPNVTFNFGGEYPFIPNSVKCSFNLLKEGVSVESEEFYFNTLENVQKTIDKNNMSYTVLAENILNNGSTIKS